MSNTNDDNTIPLLDIKREWLNPIRSLQSHARQQCGVAIISINILVNASGLPVAWTTPKVLKFEPKSNADQIIEFLKGTM